VNEHNANVALGLVGDSMQDDEPRRLPYGVVNWERAPLKPRMTYGKKTLSRSN
jgi:hypothetical protein